MGGTGWTWDWCSWPDGHGCAGAVCREPSCPREDLQASLPMRSSGARRCRRSGGAQPAGRCAGRSSTVPQHGAGRQSPGGASAPSGQARQRAGCCRRCVLPPAAIELMPCAWCCALCRGCVLLRPRAARAAWVVRPLGAEAGGCGLCGRWPPGCVAASLAMPASSAARAAAEQAGEFTRVAGLPKGCPRVAQGLP